MTKWKLYQKGLGNSLIKNNILKTIVQDTGADSAALMVPNKQDRYNYCYDSYNMPTEWVAVKNSFDEDVPGGNVEVYQTGKASITNQLCSTLEGHYIESVMILPIKRSNATIAMLELVHSAKGNSFSAEDLKIAEEFAISLEAQLPKKF